MKERQLTIHLETTASAAIQVRFGGIEFYE